MVFGRELACDSVHGVSADDGPPARDDGQDGLMELEEPWVALTKERLARQNSEVHPPWVTIRYPPRGDATQPARRLARSSGR